ncbi:MAG: LacI family DNA-binding transcriptional regulator [Rhodobacteraceae bacterium]|nr:LacI family DNA-binding transcriptional regulator [Paracoccaceae bacterium]
MVKPTVHDIAKEAGVSLATVDRVLNARPGVREATVARVQDAVDRLGYVRDSYAANLARKRQYRYVFVLPVGPNQFVDALREALIEATGAQLAERSSVKIITVPTHDPHAVARAINAVGSTRPDGLAIMVPETPQVRDAVGRLKADGIAVVTLVADLPNSARDHFVGINNRSAGRTAGVLMGRFVGRATGSVLVVTHSLQARDSIERRLGFDEVVSQEFPNLVVLPSMESYDDPVRMASIVTSAVNANPDLLGIYSMGTGNKFLLEGLRAARRPEGLVVIAHELTPATRQALEEGEVDAVIAQNVGHLVRSALRVLRAKSDDVAILASQERIRIDVIIRENLP